MKIIKFTHRNGTALLLNAEDVRAIYQMPLVGSDDMVCVIVTPLGKFEVQGLADNFGDLLAQNSVIYDLSVEEEE